jgi:hypothetical protein
MLTHRPVSPRSKSGKTTLRRLFRVVGLGGAAVSMPAFADLPAGAYDWMGTLAGSCWSATAPKGVRDTQCYRAQYDRFLRGTIEISTPDATPPYRGDSLLVWDKAKRRIDFLYWGSSGRHGRMIGRMEDGKILFTADGGATAPPPQHRTVWTRIDLDSFEVVQQRRDGETWIDGLTLRYRRQGPAPRSE